MLIPEAVQLVLQAGTLGRGGEVFMLDMGEPIRIVDLATDLIRLSGLRPKVRWPGTDRGVDVGPRDWDIEVVFTGLRPGEKLFEELIVEGEEYVPTHHAKIFTACANGDCVVCPVDLDCAVDELIAQAQRGDEGKLRAKLREIVPPYAPPERLAAAKPQDPDQEAPRVKARGDKWLSKPGRKRASPRVAEA
jgi:FlaA1/EpsC-like NDP-sugar epimerase